MLFLAQLGDDSETIPPKISSCGIHFSKPKRLAILGLSFFFTRSKRNWELEPFKIHQKIVVRGKRKRSFSPPRLKLSTLFFRCVILVKTNSDDDRNFLIDPPWISQLPFSLPTLPIKTHLLFHAAIPCGQK